MKTNDYLRKYFPILTISTLLIASTFGASAENRHKEGQGNKGHDSKEYRHPGRNNERTATNEWQNRRSGDRDERNYASHDDRHEYSPKYNRRGYHEQACYFNHPKYGRVYSRFENNPIVFNNAYGDFYYSGNSFYRYRDGIGYCISEPPRNQYYRNLPMECNRLYVNGHVFFRNGDLFFKLSPRGYKLVSSPFEIRFIARY